MKKRIVFILALAMVVLAHAGTIHRVSLAWDGSQANGDCWFGSISGDGRFVVFTSSATNLVPGDTNGKTDTFLRDLVLNTTVRVSVSTNGEEGNNDSYQGLSSEDGRYVAFTSWASNLVPEDTNGQLDIFLRDLAAGTTIRISLDTEGLQFDDGCSELKAILANGTQVVFSAYHKRPGDTYNKIYSFIRDRVARSSRFLSYIDNNQTIYPSYKLCFSEDGRYLTHVADSEVKRVDLWTNSVTHPCERIPRYPECYGAYVGAAALQKAIPGPPTYECFWNTAMTSDGSLLFINYTQEYAFKQVNNRNYVLENGVGLTTLGDVGLMVLESSTFSHDFRHVAVSTSQGLCLLDWLTGILTPVGFDLQGYAIHATSAEFATHAPMMIFSSDNDKLVSGDDNQETDVFIIAFGELPPPAVSISVGGSIKDGQGNGVDGVKLEFNPGGITSTISSGQYWMKLLSPWSGTITPSRTATQFVPPQRSLADVTTAQEGVDFLALIVTPGIGVERREDHSWMRRKSYNRVAMTVVNETTWTVAGLRLYRSKGSAAEELVRQFLPADLKDNQVTFDDLGIVASGTYQYRFWVDLANGDSISSAVVPDRN